MTKNLSQTDIVNTAQKILALSQSGLTYSKDIFDKERYEALQEIAIELLSANFDIAREDITHISEKGYATPKTDVRAFIISENKILMVRESDDGLWSLPGGWADVGDSPAQAVCREVLEETGLNVNVTKLLGVWDRNQHGHPPHPWHIYKLIFLCEETGGELAISHESLDIGFFTLDELPDLSLTRIVPKQIQVSFDIATTNMPTYFD
ncbi:NUDIX hydrolase [Pantoea sp.]|uniref:NUDIX hydrolase n=1 Tax=Pantoea sp. TaxID=69393 RepID=UPI0028A7234E|nr:NUDIX hydrolase [Pantoea sp.]